MTENQPRADESSAQPGRDAAVDGLLAEHLPAVVAFVRLHCADVVLEHESCADVVQSACREVLAGSHGFEVRGLPQFRKWLFQKVKSKLIDKRRYWIAERRRGGRDVGELSGERHIDQVSAALCSPSEAASAREALERMERSILGLADSDRRVITMIKLYGLSTREAAAELGKTEGAVRVMLHRALARLGVRMHERAASTGS